MFVSMLFFFYLNVTNVTACKKKQRGFLFHAASHARILFIPSQRFPGTGSSKPVKDLLPTGRKDRIKGYRLWY